MSPNTIRLNDQQVLIALPRPCQANGWVYNWPGIYIEMNYPEHGYLWNWILYFENDQPVWVGSCRQTLKLPSGTTISTMDTQIHRMMEGAQDQSQHILQSIMSPDPHYQHGQVYPQGMRLPKQAKVQSPYKKPDLSICSNCQRSQSLADAWLWLATQMQYSLARMAQVLSSKQEFELLLVRKMFCSWKTVSVRSKELLTRLSFYPTLPSNRVETPAISSLAMQAEHLLISIRNLIRPDAAGLTSSSLAIPRLPSLPTEDQVEQERRYIAVQALQDLSMRMRQPDMDTHVTKAAHAPSTIDDVDPVNTIPDLEKATWIDLEEMISAMTGQPEEVEQVVTWSGEDEGMWNPFGDTQHMTAVTPGGEHLSTPVLHGANTYEVGSGSSSADCDVFKIPRSRIAKV